MQKIKEETLIMALDIYIKLINAPLKIAKNKIAINLTT